MTKNRFAFPMAILASMVVIFSSCDKKVVYEKNDRIPSAVWNEDQVIEFQVEINDTLNPHHIFVNIRNLNNYPMNNLFLFVTITSPDRLFNRDTVQSFLAEPSGKWIGKGFGSVWSNRFRYKTNIRFPVTGTYHFKIEQAMRLNELEGISDVGIRIEKVE